MQKLVWSVIGAVTFAAVVAAGGLALILKLFWNPNPLIQALHIQSQLNTINAQRETERRGVDQLHFEVLHNLVLESTRMA